MDFKVSDFTNVCQFITCRSFDEFVALYESLGFIGKAYIKEKCAKARENFIYWWCELDEETQEKVILYVKKFYGKVK